MIKKDNMMKEVNPEETTRAYAFEMWMYAPMPFWKTCRKKSGNSIKHLPMNNEIISLHSHPEWRIPAARWFQGKWGNDFHDRKDLTPNVCALYVEPELRCRGIAGQLLAHICKDMAAKGIGTHRNFFTPLR